MKIIVSPAKTMVENSDSYIGSSVPTYIDYSLILLDEIRKNIEELSKASQGFATRLYQDAQAQAQANQNAGEDNNQDTGNSGNNDDVQDAEVVD